AACATPGIVRAAASTAVPTGSKLLHFIVAPKAPKPTQARPSETQRHGGSFPMRGAPGSKRATREGGHDGCLGMDPDRCRRDRRHRRSCVRVRTEAPAEARIA